MFATDYLKAYPGAQDWECVYDFACGCDTVIGHGFDISAWWSPSRELVAFGNNWHDVPDMTRVDRKPSEAEISNWVEKHPGYLWRKRQAAMTRKKEWDDRFDRTQAFYDKYGGGEVHAELRAPDGSVKVIDHVCGIHGPLFMLPLAIGWMRREMPPGTVLQKLIVYRRVPTHRGEKKITVRPPKA